MIEISDVEQMTEMDDETKGQTIRAIQAWKTRLAAVPAPQEVSDEELEIFQTMFLSGYVAALKGL